MPKRKKNTQAPKTSTATVGYEAELWKMADALRGSMDAAEYKHVVLGLIFLKYISDAFEEQHAKLEAERAAGRGSRGSRRVPEPRTSSGCRPRRAGRICRRSAEQPTIGELVDDAMAASSATIRRSRACCPRTTPAPRSTSSASAS
ncbi:MAG: hypothetical protein KatS3mg082_2195 [Nitrospiraceae bacterium]|nr:MAG: hypothetical protein KatS3mg082_2195 [Nitrospiraceae bacterium]